MPTKMFFDLSEQKRTRIIHISITEFSKYGYENSSTNRIVQNAGISKGSLFKYFLNKEELYFYILDCVTQELIASLEKDSINLPQDLFERIVRYSELEFTWYIKYPEKFRLITTAFSNKNEAVRSKVETKYKQKERDIYYKALENIDTSTLKWDKQKTVDLLKWFLTGFQEDFISRIPYANTSDINFVRQEYVKSLTDYMTIMKSGLIIEKNGE